MSIMKMQNRSNHMFSKAITACKMAFGCICTPTDDIVYIVSFEKGDEAIIRDTLECAGSQFLGVCSQTEYLEVFA